MPRDSEHSFKVLDSISPVRTCVGCGTRAAKSDLIRVVASDKRSATVDLHCDLPGRGAWFHPELTCVRRARQRKVLVRALRLSEPPDDRLWAHLERIAFDTAQRVLTLE